ncbi:VanZ family protein [Heyndrickxia sporothermodurans]|nr:VanZ family protein [Heyndrickxia sporothermodurans]
MYLLDGRFIVFLGMIGYIVIRSIFVGLQYRKWNLTFWFKEGVRILFTLYILLVISVTFFPLALWIDYSWERIKFGINLIPFVSVIHDIGRIGHAYDGDSAFMIRLIIRNVGGNILLFVPLGILIPILSKKYKDFKRMVLLGLGMSVCIEFIQFLELFAGGFGRTVDIDDVIFNTLGAVLGFLIYKILYKLIIKWKVKPFQVNYEK